MFSKSPQKLKHLKDTGFILLPLSHNIQDYSATTMSCYTLVTALLSIHSSLQYELYLNQQRWK